MVWKNHVSITIGRKIYFHNDKFLCNILMWHICKSYWSSHYHKPHQVFHTQKIYKNLQKTKHFNNFGKYEIPCNFILFAQNLAPSNFFEVVGYKMILQIAYYHFQIAISHIHISRVFSTLIHITSEPAPTSGFFFWIWDVEIFGEFCLKNSKIGWNYTRKTHISKIFQIFGSKKEKIFSKINWQGRPISPP